MKCRNPFQGGMGFFTKMRKIYLTSQNNVAIPFRVGWGFSHAGGVGVLQ